MKRDAWRARAGGGARSHSRRICLATSIWLALFLAHSAAADNRIYLAAEGGTEPVESLSVQAGASLSLDLRMDFDDRTVGGGVLVRYDPGLLHLSSVTFDEALGDDDALRCPTDPGARAPASCPASPDTISFGGIAAFAGERRVATLAFSTLATGTTPIGVSSAHPFSDVRGGDMKVTALPEPGAALQLAVAALAIVAMRPGSRAREGSPRVQTEEQRGPLGALDYAQ